MSPNLDALTAQILSLPLEDRRELVLRVWSSVENHEAVGPELLAEIERRDAEMESGAAASYTHNDVINDARKAIEQ
jgi:putative addiction module component (TIGR02574 family)